MKQSQSPATIFLAVTLLHTVQASADSRERTPNIIVFLVDDMGWTDTSTVFHDRPTELNRRYRTPNMTRLAEQGVMFTQAYASPVCTPSRVSLITGMNAARHGVTNWTLRRGKSPDPPDERVRLPNWAVNGLSPEHGVERTVVADSLPKLLSSVGYRTILVGKAHFGASGTPGANPRNLGFEVSIAGHAAGAPGSYLGENNFSAAHRGGGRLWDVPDLKAYHGEPVYLTEALSREAIRELGRSVEDAQPFFLYLSHYAIHAPWQPDARYIERYRVQGLKGQPAAYASMIEGVDKSLGDLMEWLEVNGLEENTLIWLLSDNGAPPGAPANLPLRGSKLTPYEGGVRVPMIARWPNRLAPGHRRDEPVIVEDVFSTLLQVAGVNSEELPQKVDGRNLLGLFDDSITEPPASPLVWHYPHTYYGPPWSAIRQGDWKLIWYYAEQRAELYNLRADLSESEDLAESRPAIRDKLSRELKRLLNERGALLPIDAQRGRVFRVRL